MIVSERAVLWWVPATLGPLGYPPKRSFRGDVLIARLVFLIDGGYASKLAQDHLKIWIDYRRLGDTVRHMIAEATHEPLDLLRTYYYDSLPYQSNPATEDERQLFGKRRKFFAALKELPNFEVREGRTVRRGFDMDGRPIYQQKQVDPLIGLDIVGLAVKRQITHMALLSGDSDLLPAVKIAQDEGIAVWLVHDPQGTYASELWYQADNRLLLDKLKENIRR